MAKSTVMQLSKKIDMEAAGKLTPSKKLEIAAELSELCCELKKSAEKAGLHGISRKS
ncbi:MAG: hypothetical protein HZB61_15530 [Nitrospirae bacterium]|nr:hypothetical protein [Nitrospirota bacterium]